MEFVTTLLLFYVLGCFFWPQDMRDFGSLTRDQTWTSCTERQSLNHWIAQECIVFISVRGILSPQLLRMSCGGGNGKQSGVQQSRWSLCHQGCS